MNRLSQRCVAAGVGLLIDRALGEPPTPVHPVAWFGTAMNGVEERLWAPRRGLGVAYAATGVALGWGAGTVVRSTAVSVALTAAGRMLRATAAQAGRTAESDDLDSARSELLALVGRDASELDRSGIAAAAIESLAENSVDAVVAPVFWALVGGARGAWVYRAINTMDAMVGHRSERYESFGWAAAKLDDVANYVPARIFALLVIAQSPRRAPKLWETIRDDAPAHPSPNAGVAETAVAAALGIELGGPLRYGERLENRPTLGSGPRPLPRDVPHAVAIADRAERIGIGALVVLAAGLALVCKSAP